MNYVIRVKLKPNKELNDRLGVICDSSRFIYNWLLARSITYFKQNSNKKCTLGLLQEFQKEYRFLRNCNQLLDRYGELYSNEFHQILKSVPSQVEENETKALFRAWKTLKKRRQPSFKKKHDSVHSFTIHKKTNSTFKFDNGVITVANMQFKIPSRKNRFLTNTEQIKLITVKKSTYGWYISILINLSDSIFTLEENIKSIGIDWGISKFATDSDGYSIAFKDFEAYSNYTKIEKRLVILQRRLSKKRNTNTEWKDSKRYKKLKEKVAWCYEKLANIRKSFLHVVSSMYIRENQVIVIENLKPSNMLKNHKLARSISQAMFYTWKVMLEYKAKFYGRNLILVDPKNTSQICSSCNAKAVKKLKLSTRIFSCSNCNLEIDRDYNAAINILKRA